MSFQGKVVWLTGATSGIGEAMALQLSAAGAQLVLSARRTEELERVKSNCAHPDKVIIQPLDLAQSDQFPSIVQEVTQQANRIDYLINNGGISQRSEAGETTLEVDRKIMEVNYFGNIALTKAVLPQMRKQQSGHLITISSLSGKFGFFLRSAYAASKHALAGFYESLLLEEEKNGIKVSIVYPGLISTNISKNALTGSGGKHESMDQKQATGMSAEGCATVILKGIAKGRIEIFVGKGEMKAVWIKRHFPKLFFKLIKKQNPT